MKNQIQFKKGLVANINSTITKNNAVEGEPHYATDTKEVYVFDGTNNIPIQRTKGVYTVATLPIGVQGDRAIVTDATAPTFLTALTGGGAVVTPAFHNGTIWVSA